MNDLEIEVLAHEGRNRSPLGRLSASEAIAVVRALQAIDLATIRAKADDLGKAKAARAADQEKQRNRFPMVTTIARP